MIEKVANVLNVASFQSTLRWTTADRRLCEASCNRLEDVAVSRHDAPILSMVEASGLLIYGDMAGNLVLAAEGATLDRRNDHKKYVVRVAAYEAPEGIWVSSAGWDAKVCLYWIPHSRRPPKLLDPVATVELPSNPESLLFVRCPDSDQIYLLLSRRDSTFIYYYRPDSRRTELELVGRQNLAPHAISWVTFTPSEIRLCPLDPSRVAVATSSIPHMKLLIVRLLFPAHGLLAMSSEAAVERPTSAAAEERSRDLQVQNREEAAIMIACNTLAPQTQWSSPVVVWRPDGSGLFVGGDDGKIRGVEASTGKVICHLEAHEPAKKIRCLWTGKVDEEEWLLSGGFDQQLVLWR